ncbi:MAG: HAD family hydrolase [Candidatus Thermoplasmatota archaeon]|nr:HAD family hydrolase [Candidatus Thermoplasmatota archaeon]
MKEQNSIGTRKAFFLDRDGVINENNPNYVKKPEDLILIPGAAEAIRKINQAGWLVVVVTNQAMIGRGIATHEDFHAIMRKLLKQLAEEGARIDAFYYCPDIPEGNPPCRKPNPGMLLQAAKDLDIDISASVMVGDLPSDVEAGKRAGTMRQELVTKNRSLLDVVKDIIG